MKKKHIRTKRDYESALRAIEPLMGAKRNTPEGYELETLVTLIVTYEAQRFALDRAPRDPSK